MVYDSWSVAGYYLDMDLGGDQQFKVTLQRLTTALEAMKYKFPGTKGKEYAMRMVVMPRVGYTGQGANLTEERYRNWTQLRWGMRGRTSSYWQDFQRLH